MLSLLKRNRGFALLLSAGLTSWLGSWVLMTALPIYVYERTGSALATGAMFVVQALPALLLGSVAGVFVDRWDRKRVMVGADLLRGLLLLPLLLVPTTGAIWIVYVVGFLQEIVSRFAEPAFSAALPKVVGEDSLVEANSTWQLGFNTSRLVGPPLGGLLVALFGLEAAVVVDSVSFFLSAALVSLIHLPRAAPAVVAAAGAAWRRVWREWRDGLALVRGERWLTALFLAMAASGLAEGVLSIAYPIWVYELLGGGAQEVGWLLSAQALGSIAGAALAVHFARWLAPARLMGLVGVVLGAYWAAMVWFRPELLVALVFMAAIGVPMIAANVAMTSMLQAGVADAYRGRVFGALFTTIALTAMVGRAVATLAGDALGVVSLLSIVAAFDVLSGLIALSLLHTARPPRLAAAEAPVVG